MIIYYCSLSDVYCPKNNRVFRLFVVNFESFERDLYNRGTKSNIVHAGCRTLHRPSEGVVYRGAAKTIQEKGRKLIAFRTIDWTCQFGRLIEVPFRVPRRIVRSPGRTRRKIISFVPAISGIGTTMLVVRPFCQFVLDSRSLRISSKWNRVSLSFEILLSDEPKY